MATIVNEKIVSQKQCPTIGTIKNVEAIYKKYAELPTITSGTIGIESETQNVKIKIYQAQKDLINDKVEKYSTEYLLQRNNIMDHNNNNNNKNNNHNNFKKITSSAIPNPLNCMYETTSPDGEYVIKLICMPNKDGKKKYFFDIYGINKRLHRISLDKHHGDVILKNPFHNGFSWAKPSSSFLKQKLVYIAEGKKDAPALTSRKPNILSFFNDIDDVDNNTTNETKYYTKTSEYEFEDDYGEQLENIKYPQPYVLTFDRTGWYQIDTIVTNKKNIAFGTPVFTSNNKSIVCTGWGNIQLRRPGIIYYNTRPSKLYQIYLPSTDDNTKNETKMKCITLNIETDYSCCNPAFINDTLVYLTTIKTQRHNSASRLKCMKYDPANDTFLCISNDILIDVQPCIIPIAISIDGETAITTSSEECDSDEATTGSFNGIYDRGTWPTKQLFLNEDVIVFSSSNHSCMDMYFYNLKSRSMYQFEISHFLRADKNEGYACRVLASKDNLILWTFAKRNMMERVFLTDVLSLKTTIVGKMSSPHAKSKSKSSSTITLQATSFENTLLDQMIHSITSKIITLEKDDILYQGILSFPPPKDEQLNEEIHLPLIVMPHGGPHSNILANQDIIVALMNTLGYGVLCLNYRGSLGFGMNSESSLPGNIGRNDVVDCNALLQYTLKTYEKIFNSKDIFVVGGSHGGFLTAHLISQYPDVYNAACK